MGKGNYYVENIYNYIRVLFGIFMPRSIYENYTDADLEDSTYEEYSYADSEDSVYGDYPYPDPEYAAGRGNLKTYNNKDYDPTKTDWENYGDTGSIMEIADTDWALENAPVFHVETKEQLAWSCVLCQCSQRV